MKLIDLREKMGRKKKSQVLDNGKYTKVNTIIVDGHTIEQGEMIKIKGEHGSRFKFISVTKNNDNGLEWVDCVEYEKGFPRAMRSFDKEKVSRIPKRRKHVERS